MLTKKIIRVKIQDGLRKAGLLPLAEKARYYSKLWSLRGSNKIFIEQNPGFVLPPEHLAFDAYSAPDWTFYKSSGEGTAKFLATTIKKYLPAPHQVSSVYEWGCGPARVVRHLPHELGSSIEVYGTDYNPETITWCRASIPGVQFDLNGLNPPLPFTDNKFDFIYSISVFTHLSRETGLHWARELYRVLKPNGILLITTSGDNAYDQELLENEKIKYQNEGVVVRGNYEEGKKMYLARHNPRYVREELLKDFSIEEHSPAGFPFIAQDYWIARKTSL
jgi:SAM-dependent methyltransferase